MKNRVNPALLPGLEMYPDQDLRPECLPVMREEASKVFPPTIVDETLSVTNEVIEGPDANPLRLKFIVQNQIMNPYLLCCGYMVADISWDL